MMTRRRERVLAASMVTGVHMCLVDRHPPAGTSLDAFPGRRAGIDRHQLAGPRVVAL